MFKSAIVAAITCYSVDNNGTLWLRMYDAEGGLICISIISRGNVFKLLDFIDEHMDLDDDDDDPVGEVAGNA